MASSGSRTNIVFIMADDMGFGDIGCYGSSKIPTPHVDRLAERGVRFTDAHTPSSVCTPTRYGVLTGRYCWRSSLKRGVLDGYSRPIIEPDRPTVASVLRQAGYATGCFGKWHLGLGWAGEGRDIDYTARIDGGPIDLGFDTFFGIPASLDFPPYAFIQDDRTVGLPVGSKDPLVDSQRPGPVTPDFDDLNVDQLFARKAIEFMRRCVGEQPDRPFFVYLPTSAPHRPCMAPPPYRGASQAGCRGDKVAEFDGIVGQVVDALDEMGVRDNTLVIVTSDNGARPGDPVVPDDNEWHAGRERVVLPGDFTEDELFHGHMGVPWAHYGHKSNGDWTGYKTDIWDGGHRVVFVASWPGAIPEGRTSEEVVCLTDLLATAAGIAGVPLPAGAGPDSYDILPALRGESSQAPIREATVHHSIDGTFSIRQGSWKFVEGVGSGGASATREGIDRPADPGQLYDLASDPREESNLIHEQPEVVARLQALLDRYRQSWRSIPRRV